MSELSQEQPEQRNLRGRGLTPIKPGVTIKSVLIGQIPLKNGQYVTEASITDLHNVYKRLIKQENLFRDKEHHLHGMNVYSFTTLFKFCRYLGLVEHVRDEPRYEPSYGNLYRVEDGTGLHIVQGTRKIYRLTDKGREDEVSWLNLCKAWQEQHTSKPKEVLGEEEI